MALTLKDNQANQIVGVGLTYTYDVLIAGMYTMDAFLTSVTPTRARITLEQSGSQDVGGFDTMNATNQVGPQTKLKFALSFNCAPGDVLTATVSRAGAGVINQDNQLNTVKTTLIVTRTG